MLTKKQIKILNLFSKNTFKEYTFKEIKEKSKEKSTSLIQDSIKAFLKEEFITERKIGTSKLYKINHNNNIVYAYFEIFNKENLLKSVQRSIKLIQEELEKHIFFYSIVIFGSYATREQKKDSDLDIAIFIEKKENKKKVEAAINSAENKSLLNIDGHVITKDEFLEMLKVDYENLGKQIARKHLIIHNPFIFYSLLKEGIKNGFRL